MTNIKSLLAGVFMAASAVGLMSTSVHATVIGVGASADAWLSDTNSDGIIDTLSGSALTDPFLRTFGVSSLTRSVLEFSLAGVTSGAMINAASFQIKDNGTTVVGGNFEFYGYSADGVITVADGNQTGNLITSTPMIDGNPLYTIDVTAFVQSLVDTSASHAGILIKSSLEGSGFFGGDLSSSEWSTVADRPSLTVDFTMVPEPGMLALFSLGLAGLGFARRKKKTA